MSNATIYAIAKHFGLKPSDILGKQRSTRIGNKLNGRDHTTNLHTLKMAEIAIERSKRVAAIFEEEMALSPHRFINVPASEEQMPPPPPPPPISPEDRRYPAILTKRVKPRNEHVKNDHDARMRMHGTNALLRALQTGDCGNNRDLIWNGDPRAASASVFTA